MWKKIAILSLVTNAAVAMSIALWLPQRLRTTTVVQGELAVPLMDFAFLFRPEAQNTKLITIKTEDGGHQACRLPSVDALIGSPSNRYGNPSAVVRVEVERPSDSHAVCRSITTVYEGWVPTPK